MQKRGQSDLLRWIRLSLLGLSSAESEKLAEAAGIMRAGPGSVRTVAARAADELGGSGLNSIETAAGPQNKRLRPSNWVAACSRTW